MAAATDPKPQLHPSNASAWAQAPPTEFCSHSPQRKPGDTGPEAQARNLPPHNLNSPHKILGPSLAIAALTLKPDSISNLTKA